MLRLRSLRPSRSILVITVLAGVLLVAALVLPRLPRPLAAVGTLDQCYWGWPVLAFEGEDWKDSLPDERRASAPGSIPIASWPTGLRFDEDAGVLLDAGGEPVFRKGDRVRIEGSVIEVHGDPSPCFYTLGVKVDAIAVP